MAWSFTWSAGKCIVTPVFSSSARTTSTSGCALRSALTAPPSTCSSTLGFPWARALASGTSTLQHSSTALHTLALRARPFFLSIECYLFERVVTWRRTPQSTIPGQLFPAAQSVAGILITKVVKEKVASLLTEKEQLIFDGG